MGPVTASPVSIRRMSTDRIDVAPVLLRLGMDVGIAIDFRSRGLENLGAQPLGEPEHVDGAVHARLGGLHGIMLVVNGRCRAGEIVDLVDLDIERESNVVTYQLEPLSADEMGDVALGAGEEIIDADDVRAPLQQALAQMRAEEAGAAGHENTFFKVHATIQRRRREMQCGGHIKKNITQSQRYFEDRRGAFQAAVVCRIVRLLRLEGRSYNL